MSQTSGSAAAMLKTQVGSAEVILLKIILCATNLFHLSFENRNWSSMRKLELQLQEAIAGLKDSEQENPSLSPKKISKRIEFKR